MSEFQIPEKMIEDFGSEEEARNFVERVLHEEAEKAAAAAYVDPAVRDRLLDLFSQARGRLVASSNTNGGKYPFFGYLAMRLKPRVVGMGQCPSIAAISETGVMSIRVDAMKFVPEGGTELGWMTFLVLHEVLHPAHFFWERRGSKDFRLWNIAHDYVINSVIVDAAGPEGYVGLPAWAEWPWPRTDADLRRMQADKAAGRFRALYNPEWREWTAEEVYNLLEKERPKDEDEGQGQGKGQGQEDEGEGKGQGQGQGKGQGQGQGQGKGKGQDQGQGQDSSQWDDCKDEPEGSTGEDKGEGEGDGDGPINWREIIIEAAVRTSMQRGVVPATFKKMVEEWTEPKISWAEALSRWVGENGSRGDLSYRQLSRRGMIFDRISPGMTRFGVPQIIVFWDTSGSMNGRESVIIPELASMAEELNMELRVIPVDCQVHADAKGVRDIETIAQLALGGGGSDFTPAFEHIKNDPDLPRSVVVAFTDGYIGTPDEPPPGLQGTLWVTWEHDARPAAWGTWLRIQADGSAEFAP